MGQIATLLTKRQQGSLLSNAEVNPKREGKEHVKAITLRNGRELVASGLPPVVVEVEIETTVQTNQEEQLEGEQPQERK